jgi:preprotein translocase subunit YajC
VELLVPLAILGLMWALLVRPQQRRVREHRDFVAGVQVGDDVITTAGLFGTITALDDDRARLVVAPGVELTIARQAIGRPQPSVAAPAVEPPTSDDPE